MRVPIVSNISTRSSVISTARSEARGAEKSSPKPTKHCPNIEKSSAGTKLSGAFTPISTLKTNWHIFAAMAVTIIPINMAPFTF